MQTDKDTRLQRAIIDAVIDLQYSLTYKCSAPSERDKMKEAFWGDIYTLYRNEQSAFEKATEDIILNRCDYLNTEEALIRLECVGIFGKTPFYAWIFRLRLRLDIDVAKTVEMLRSTVAQIKKRNDAAAQFDVWIFNDLLIEVSNEPYYSATVKERILDISDPASVSDVEGAIAFEAIRSAQKKGAIPGRIADVALGGRELSVISIDGLEQWYSGTNKSTIKKLKSALWRIGAKETSRFFAKLLEMSDLDPQDAQSPTEKLSALEKELFDLMSKENYERLAEGHLSFR